MRIIRFSWKRTTSYSIASSLLIWLFILIVIFFLSLIKNYLLAEKFYFDSGNIVRQIDYASLSLGNSYTNTAYLYSLFGVSDNTLLFSIVSTILFVWFCMTHIRYIYPASISIVDIPLVLFLLILGCAYLTVVSKEFIVLILMIGFWAAFNSSVTFFKVLWVGAALLYGLYFREYWLGVIALFLLIRYIFRYQKYFLLVPCIVFFWLLLDVFLRYRYGWSLSEYRFTVNDGRESDPNSMTVIANLLPVGGPVNSLVNAIWSSVISMFPIDLVALGTGYHSILFFMLSWLSWRFLKSFLALKTSSIRSGYLVDSFAIVIAYFCTLAPLEPDHGSGVKHLAPFFPILFMLIFRSYGPAPVTAPVK